MSLRRALILMPFAAAVAYQGVRWWTVTQFYRIDFSVYYYAVDSGEANLYDYRFVRSGLQFNYPPFAAVMLKPLTWLSYESAEYIWFLSSLACVAGFAWCVADELRVERGALRSAALCFLVVMVPVTLTLRLGQINAIVALLVLLDVRSMSRRNRWAGVGTGLAAALKVTPGFIIVVLLACRRFREAAAAVAAFGATVALSLLLYPQATWRYWTSILWDSSRVGDVETTFNQRQPDGFVADFSNSLRRPVAWLPGDRETHAALWVAASVIVTMLAIVGARRAFAKRDVFLAITLASVAGYLVSPITWAHHLFFAGPAVLLVLGERRSLYRSVWALIGAVVLIDPFEGGEGSYVSLARIGFLLAFVVAAATPRMNLARTRCRENPSVAH